LAGVVQQNFHLVTEFLENERNTSKDKVETLLKLLSFCVPKLTSQNVSLDDKPQQDIFFTYHEVKTKEDVARIKERYARGDYK